MDLSCRLRHYWIIKWLRLVKIYDGLEFNSITQMQWFNLKVIPRVAKIYCIQVRIDKKINSWSGSIEMGVTQCDPNTLESPFPSRFSQILNCRHVLGNCIAFTSCKSKHRSSATELREGTWIMSGNSILKVTFLGLFLFPHRTVFIEREVEYIVCKGWKEHQRELWH